MAVHGTESVSDPLQSDDYKSHREHHTHAEAVPSWLSKLDRRTLHWRSSGTLIKFTRSKEKKPQSSIYAPDFDQPIVVALRVAWNGTVGMTSDSRSTLP